MDRARQQKRGLAFVALGIALPPFAMFMTAKLVPPPPGMDGYLPAMLGGMVGLVVSLGLLVQGVRDLVNARRSAP